MNSSTRIEHDLLGERAVPAACYYGIQTLRALDNFQITGIPISSSPEMIRALAFVKKAACLANKDLSMLPEHVSEPIMQACDEIIAGQWHEQFVVDAMQGGAGTSTNMNANEVIANRALETMGHAKGNYEVIHPNNHVNCSQSTNDVYPTAFRLALHSKLTGLTNALDQLGKAFEKKGTEFADVIKMGRTQLQDAVPMTLGQAFSAYSTTIFEDILRVTETRQLIEEINLGATAIGTGLNAHPDYTEIATRHLGELSGVPVRTSINLIEATWDTGAYVQVSGVLKRIAVKLSKICSDLRLISSGPRAGFNEINLPKVQPGSSIMPGKVNPVIPEVVNQIAYQVIGADLTVTMACENGQLELNVMEPVIAFNLFNAIDWLTRGCATLQEKCIAGITANRDVCRRMVENSIGIITALTPDIGYEMAGAVAREALETQRPVYDLILEKGLMDKQTLETRLMPENIAQPHGKRKKTR